MRNILMAWVAGLFVFLSACYDDKGNYDYSDINEITIDDIEGLNLGAWNDYIAYVDTLRLYPKFSSSMAADESNYTYEWKIVPSNADEMVVGDTVNYVIATTRNLEWPISCDAGMYRCFYTVTDNASGLRFTQKFYLRIATLTTEGWMVLCEQDGKARMDMVVNMNENEDIISRNIWAESDFDPGKPDRLIYNFYAYDPPSTVSLLVTDKGTYNMDRNDLHVGEDNNLRWQFGAQPDEVHVRASGICLYDYDWNTDEYYPLYWTVVDDKGDVYLNNVSELGGLFDFPVNKIDGVPFEAAPFVGVSYRYLRQGMDKLFVQSVLLYDKTNQRFLEVKAGAGAPSVMTFSGTTMFTAEQKGRDMVFLQSTTNAGLNYAILQDAAGDYYYYGIVLGANGVNTQSGYGKLEGTDVENATHFAFHPTLNWLFYSTKDKIYKVDLSNSSRNAELVADLQGETISVLKFNPFVAFRQYEAWQDNRNFWLVVGSNIDGEDETECGIMRVYEFDNQWANPARLTKTHTRLGHIIDIAYKESVN